MYQLKPYYDPNAPIVIPDCMYRLKTYNGSSNTLQQKAAGSEMIVDVAVLKQLEDRQENILKKLEQLKVEVAKLTGAEVSSTNQKPVDVVISAHPASPPVCLLVLQQLLTQQQKVMTSCHRHSSARDVTEKHMCMLNSDVGGVTTDRNLYDVIFTLIWKDVSHGPSMMVNPRLQTSVQGEGSIARYLARLLAPAYDTAEITIATEIDQWVDSAMQYQRGNNKEKSSVLKAANSKLGKNEWLVGSGMSLADVMLWGVLTGEGAGESAPGNVKKWYQRCSELEPFRVVLSRL